MASDPAVAAFDQISKVYDATREPMEAPLVESLRSTLGSWGIDRLLEVGVGTGRIALPLTAAGLEVTGVDASAGMLAFARSKKLDRLVRGSAYRLPFADGSFDAALFVHVLHILEEPQRALSEACRVGRVGAVAVVRPGRSGTPEPERSLRPRALVIDRLRREGVDVPDRASGGPPVRERRLLEQSPPDRLVLLSESDVTEPLADELNLFVAGASRWTLHVPAEALARAVAEVRRELGDRTWTYHRTVSLALWEHPPRAPTPSTTRSGERSSERAPGSATSA